ncbi:hypothetical protein AAG584_22725 [Vreelandella titanicae]|mgnify:FL=1|nr:hypothetical protein [Halomonas titanicae]
MADNVKNSSVKVMIAIDIAKTSHDASFYGLQVVPKRLSFLTR